MKNIILLLVICFGYYSCMFQGFSQSFENTVTLVDVTGKPIKGRKVRILKSSSSFLSSISPFDTEIKSAITDNNGQAVLNYDLDISDSTQDFAFILGEDDDSLKTVEVATHTLTNKKSNTIKRTATVVMDSMVPFKIRVKTDKSEVENWRVQIRANASSESFERSFADKTFLANNSKIDTTISVLVYSKTDFIIRNILTITNNNGLVSNEKLIQNNVNRNVVFLLEF